VNVAESYEYLKLTSEESKDILENIDFAILVIGSVEQHSKNLPLGTTIMLPKQIAKRVLEKARENGISTVLLPPIYYGYSDEHTEFPGTISIRSEILVGYLYDICASLAKNKVKRIFIINGHGGNLGVLDIVSRKIGTDFGIFVFYLYPYIKEVSEILTSEIGGIGHAGELETSLFLYLYPELVRRDKMTKEIPKQLNNLGTDSRTPKSVHFGWFKLNSMMTESGTVGDPLSGTPEKGKMLLETVVNQIVNALKELKEINNLKKK